MLIMTFQRISSSYRIGMAALLLGWNCCTARSLDLFPEGGTLTRSRFVQSGGMGAKGESLQARDKPFAIAVEAPLPPDAVPLDFGPCVVVCRIPPWADYQPRGLAAIGIARLLETLVCRPDAI